MRLDLERATKPAIGVTLFTRDGAHMGNAIIVDIIDQNNRPRIYIETDFGNRTNMFIEELETIFTYGFVSTVEEWQADRYDLLRKE